MIDMTRLTRADADAIDAATFVPMCPIEDVDTMERQNPTRFRCRQCRVVVILPRRSLIDAMHRTVRSGARPRIRHLR